MIRISRDASIGSPQTSAAQLFPASPPLRIDAGAYITNELWPLVRVSFLRAPTDEEFASYLRWLEHIYAQKRLLGFILDARRYAQLSAAQVRLQGEWIRDNEETVRRLCLGVAFLFSSPASRFVLSAIFLIKPLPSPYLVCKTQDEAFAWLSTKLQQRGLTTTESIALARRLD